MKNLDGHSFFTSWSGGKDSCLALYHAIQHCGIPKALLTMMTEDKERSRSHGLPITVFKKQASSLDIPLVLHSSSWAEYEETFLFAARELRKEGVEHGVFGDIDLPEHKAWVDRVCSEVGVESIEPLWRYDPKAVLTEFVNSGFKAIVINVKADLFGEDWLGRELNAQFIADLPDTIHLCGEHGEYHTFVLDGPLFQQRVEILSSNTELKDGNWLLDISEYNLSDK